MTMTWVINPKFNIDDVPDLLGLIPSFLDDADDRSARQQLDANYGHGGGWRPMQGFTLRGNGNASLHYKGDPPLEWIAVTNLRDEVIHVFRYSWVMITQPNGSYEIARMD